jgi:DNA-binding Lrp family transcriptional regulator
MDDRKIQELLTVLATDARLTHPQIAAMIGESPEAVTAAIGTLEATGAILRYGALIDWERVGVEQVSALIDVKIIPQRDVGFDHLAQRIARFQEVKSCYLMSGTYDLAVTVEAPSLKDVARFVSERLSTLEGVASTTTHFVLKRYKHDGAAFGQPDGDQRLAVTP